MARMHLQRVLLLHLLRARPLRLLQSSKHLVAPRRRPMLKTLQQLRLARSRRVLNVHVCSSCLCDF